MLGVILLGAVLLSDNPGAETDLGTRVLARRELMWKLCSLEPWCLGYWAAGGFKAGFSTLLSFPKKDLFKPYKRQDRKQGPRAVHPQAPHIHTMPSIRHRPAD